VNASDALFNFVQLPILWPGDSQHSPKKLESSDIQPSPDTSSSTAIFELRRRLQAHALAVCESEVKFVPKIVVMTPE